MKEVFFSKYVFAVLCILVLLVIVWYCFIRGHEESYTIDYCGEKECYEGARDSYPVGTKVKLCYGLIASDTDYSFYLDEQPLQYEYDSEKGFVIQFTMPKHDVKLECVTKNTMVYEDLEYEGD